VQTVRVGGEALHDQARHHVEWEMMGGGEEILRFDLLLIVLESLL
jgi:hypothetical protein